MPNWCSNMLTITARTKKGEAQLRRFNRVLEAPFVNKKAVAKRIFLMFVAFSGST